MPAMMYSAQGRAMALPKALYRLAGEIVSPSAPYAVQPSGKPMSRSLSNSVGKRTQPSAGSSSK